MITIFLSSKTQKNLKQLRQPSKSKSIEFQIRRRQCVVHVSDGYKSLQAQPFRTLVPLRDTNSPLVVIFELYSNSIRVDDQIKVYLLIFILLKICLAQIHNRSL